MARPTRRDIPKTRAEGAAAISDQCAHVPWVDSPTLGLLTLPAYAHHRERVLPVATTGARQPRSQVVEFSRLNSRKM